MQWFCISINYFGYALKTGQILLQKSRVGRFFCPPSAGALRWAEKIAHPTSDKLSRVKFVAQFLINNIRKLLFNTMASILNQV